MKKTNILTVFLLLIVTQQGFSQITQLELASGFSKTGLSSFSIKPISKDLPLSLATLAFFQKYHDQENTQFDETGVQTTIFWNINEAVSVGPGLYFNSVAGFSQRLSVLLKSKSNNFMATAIPTVSRADKTGSINAGLFLQLYYTRPMNATWNLLFSTQALTHWAKFKQHSRSFQQIRVGVEYKALQFGPAIDLDQYGSKPLTRSSFGLFIRKTFINN